MNLFEVLPQNLFSVLVSKNKHIYVDALFVLRKAFKQDMSILKRDLISMLVASLEDELLDMDLSEDSESKPENDEADSVSGMAHFIIRRMRDTQWLEIEYGTESFEEFVTLPDYSIRIINMLFSFTQENMSEYNSYVYTTYSALKTANQERDEFMFNALATAFDNTIRLVDEIKTLHNNIRRYHQSLTQYSKINDILKGHFDDFKNLVADRVYHPLKTLDSVPRFKTPILKILSEWMSDVELRKKICKQAIIRGILKNEEDAMEEVLYKIREIMDTYEKLESMLEEIDRKNNLFTRASIDKMRYLLNTDRSLKGRIIEMLKMVASEDFDENSKMLTGLSESICLFQQCYLDEKSLYVRAARNKKIEGEPMTIKSTDEIDFDDSIKSLEEKARRTFTHRRIMDFMKEQLQERDVIVSSEMNIDNDESFVFLMFSALEAGKKEAFYNADINSEYISNKENASKKEYRYPYIKFERKGI